MPRNNIHVTEGVPNDDRSAILISGGRTTAPLAGMLSQHYQLAVEDSNTIRGILAGGEKYGLHRVLCPATGVRQGLRDKAMNDGALLAARAAGIAPILERRVVAEGGPSLSFNDWLPGMAASVFGQLALNVRALDAFSEMVPVAGIVTHEDLTPQFRTLALWGKARGLPTIHIPHANCFLVEGPDIHEESVCDWILAAGTYMRDWYADRGFPKERIVITGNPAWDGWTEMVRTISKGHARRVLRVPDGAGPVVAYCTSWPQLTNLTDDHEIWKSVHHEVLAAAKERDWRMIWKLHPGDRDEMVQQSAALCEQFGVGALVTKDHLPYVLRAADAALCVGPSNVLVEAALAEIGGLAIINMRNYEFDGEPPWRCEADKDSVAAAVDKALSHPWDREAFIEHYATANDGRSKERAVRAILDIVPPTGGTDAS